MLCKKNATTDIYKKCFLYLHFANCSLCNSILKAQAYLYKRYLMIFWFILQYKDKYIQCLYASCRAVF